MLSSRAQAVLEPPWGHLVDYLRRTSGHPRGPLVIPVPQEVEDDFASTVCTHGRWAPYCRGKEAATPPPVGHRARDGHRPRAGEVGSESDAAGVFAGSAPRRIGGGVAPGLRDSAVPGRAEPPRVEVGGVPPDVGVARGQLVHAQRPGVAGADRRVVVQSDICSSDRACPGPECHHMFPEPSRASALVHHQVSSALRLLLQRVHCRVWVLRHFRSYQQGGAAGESTGPGLACPHLHYHPLGLVLRLLCRSGALVVPGHQPHRRRRVGWGAQGLGPRHIRVRLSVLAFRQYVLEDVHEGRRRVVCHPPRGGGWAAPTAVAPDVKVQAVRGHQWASFGVLLSPRGPDESQAGSRVPMVWKRWTKASRHPGWLVGSCSQRQ